MLLRFSGTEPLYRQIYQSVRKSILTGELSPGTRLPPSRALARENGVSRNVVLLAYDQLVAEGYAVPRTGSGTYVASPLPEALLSVTSEGATQRGGRKKARAERLSEFGRYADRLHLERKPQMGAPRPKLPYDFQYGEVAPDPITLEKWRRLLHRRAEHLATQYAPAAGHEGLRSALGEHVRRARGISCRPEQMIVVNGAQQALDLVARVLLDPGDRVLIEEPHYQGARHAFRAAGAVLSAIAVDGEGFDISSARQDAREARLAYVTPSHQFPTGAVMPLQRRLKLLEWAGANDSYVVEDDYDSEYRYRGRPLEAIQALDPDGRTIYVGTLSKVLFPALRLGFLIVPGSLAHAFLGAKWIADRHSPTVLQAAIADYIQEGHFERHLRRTRARNAERRTALLDSLHDLLGERIEVEGSNAGIHLLVWLRDFPTTNLARLVEQASRKGVGLYPVTPYYIRPPRRAGLLFGYASLNKSEIGEGIRRFAAALKEVR